MWSGRFTELSPTACMYKEKILFMVLLCVVLTSCKKDQRGLVVGKIQRASQLATTEFTIEKMVIASEGFEWMRRLLGVKQAHFVVTTKAVVKTGIDLQKIDPEKIKFIDEDGISIELPRVEVINFSYHPKDFHLVPELNRETFFNKIDPYEQEKLFRNAELDIRNNLDKMGVVETTQQKTNAMLQALLSSLGYERIYIQYEPGLKVDTISIKNKLLNGLVQRKTKK